MGASFAPSSARAPGLDLLDQVSEHVVEKADLLVIEAGCMAEIKVGHAPENFRASIARACGENLFEFVDNRRGL